MNDIVMFWSSLFFLSILKNEFILLFFINIPIYKTSLKLENSLS